MNVARRRIVKWNLRSELVADLSAGQVQCRDWEVHESRCTEWELMGSSCQWKTCAFTVVEAIRVGLRLFLCEQSCSTPLLFSLCSLPRSFVGGGSNSVPSSSECDGSLSAEVGPPPLPSQTAI